MQKVVRLRGPGPKAERCTIKGPLTEHRKLCDSLRCCQPALEHTCAPRIFYLQQDEPRALKPTTIKTSLQSYLETQNDHNKSLMSRLPSQMYNHHTVQNLVKRVSRRKDKEITSFSTFCSLRGDLGPRERFCLAGEPFVFLLVLEAT